MLQSIDKKRKILFYYIVVFILLSTQVTKKQHIEKKINNKINNIEVYGLSEEENFNVIESLNILPSQNIFFLNEKIFNKVLEKNNLIESFYIKKIYPNIIKINIKKISFLAITNKNNKKYYIGSNGKLISIDEINNFNQKLPFVYTKNNYGDFINLKKIIDKSAFQYEEIESFYNFPSNRWDIKTKNGLLIKLHEKKIFESLQLAHAFKKNKQSEENKIIDFRISNHIVVSNE